MISQQKQPMVGYMNEDCESNLSCSVTVLVNNGHPRDLIVHLSYMSHTKSISNTIQSCLTLILGGMQ